MTRNIILIGNPHDVRTSRYAQAYRDAGFNVTIQSALQTCAVGGKEFRTIVVDELETLLYKWQKSAEDFSCRMQDLRKAMLDLAAAELCKQIVHEQVKPKNQPHGPQRKGCGGKLKRW